MIFAETSIGGCFTIDLEPHRDARGAFSRTFCREEFEAHGLPTDFPQCNISSNRLKGTLRGMHFRHPPYDEGKLVRCVRGAAIDVVLDLRKSSQTCGRWLALELSADNGRAVYVPEGCAHGFQTLVDGTDIFYQMTCCYVPGHDSGVRWNDPAFGIRWPVEPPVLSDRDSSFADWAP